MVEGHVDCHFQSEGSAEEPLGGNPWVSGAYSVDSLWVVSDCVSDPLK